MEFLTSVAAQPAYTRDLGDLSIRIHSETKEETHPCLGLLSSQKSVAAVTTVSQQPIGLQTSMTTAGRVEGAQSVAAHSIKVQEGRRSDQTYSNSKENKDTGHNPAKSQVDPSLTPSSAPLPSTSRMPTPATSATSSLHNSPLLSGSNTFSNPLHYDGENGFREQQFSSQQHFQPNSLIPQTGVYNVGANNGNGSPHSNAAYLNNNSNRTRASTSTLPASHASILNSLPQNAQMLTTTAVASTSPSYQYRTNGMQAPLATSLSSTPSTSSQASLQNNIYLQHQLQQQMVYEKHTVELTNCIIAFLSPILPTEEEYRIKEATRRQLERLAGRVSPGAKLLAFGSMANGFALRNSGEWFRERHIMSRSNSNSSILT